MKNSGKKTISALSLNMRWAIGNRLRRHRESLDTTTEKMAYEINMSPQNLAMIERGERAISLRMLYRLAKEYNVSVHEFIPYVYLD